MGETKGSCPTRPVGELPEWVPSLHVRPVGATEGRQRDYPGPSLRYKWGLDRAGHGRVVSRTALRFPEKGKKE